MPPLKNPRHEIFAQQVAKGSTHQYAAEKCGFRGKNVDVTAAKTIKLPLVKARIVELQEISSYRAGLSAERVLEEMRRLAFSNLASFKDDNGNFKPWSQLDADQQAALAGSEDIMKNAEAGDGHIDRVYKIRLHDKTKALDMLGKYFGLFQERVQHSGELKISWEDESE